MVLIRIFFSVLNKILGIEANQTRMEKNQELLIAQLKKLTLTIDQLYTMLKSLKENRLVDSSICHSNNRSDESANKFEEKFVFPLDTVSDILKFNKEISSNEEYKKYLVSFYFCHANLSNMS